MTHRADDPDAAERIRLLGAAVDAHARAQAGTIRGVSNLLTEIRIDQGSAGFGLTAAVHLDGWGPSLHHRRLTWLQSLGAAVWRQDMIARGEPPERADAIIDMASTSGLPGRYHGAMPEVPIDEIISAYGATLAFVVHVQRTLSSEAARLGVDAPLIPPSDPHATQVGHLQVSIPLVDALVARHGARLALERIRESVRLLLVGDDGKRDDSLDGRTTGPDEMVCGITGHMGVPVYWEATPVGTAIFDGMFLTLPCELPDTVAIAAPGRLVGEIAGTGIPSLDAARILTVHPAEMGDSEFEVEAPTTLLRDHPRLAPLLSQG